MQKAGSSLAAGLFAAAGLILAALAPAPASAQEISRHLAGIDAAFVLHDSATGKTLRLGGAHASRRFAPCSTFKIPNTALLLEAGVAGLDEKIRYDPALGIKNPAWARDLSLRDAYHASALWVFRSLARKAGVPEVRRILSKMDYGNGRMGDRIRDRPFWVDGTLLISPDEQVDFLQRLREGRLGLSARTTALTREAMVADRGARWTLSAKTGSCRAEDGGVNLWYVGYVEREDATHYFALHMSAPTYQPLMDRRIPITRAILADLGLID